MGLEIACLAASTMRLSPLPMPMPIWANPRDSHDRAHIREVQVDQRGHRDQVGNALNALTERIVRNAERFSHGRALGHDTEQAIVRNDDQRVDVRLQAFDARFGVTHTLTALKQERLRNDADGENAHIARNFRNYRSRARAGAARPCRR